MGPRQLNCGDQELQRLCFRAKHQNARLRALRVSQKLKKGTVSQGAKSFCAVAVVMQKAGNKGARRVLPPRQWTLTLLLVPRRCDPRKFLQLLFELLSVNKRLSTGYRFTMKI